MNAGLVSVIIPTYNRADCIAKAIDSVLGQTYGDIEVILIDDGSKDDTRAVINDTYGKDERVRYVHQQNGGVSAARNHGIRLVKGAYAALLDSDDVWKPFKLELQLACLKAFPDAGMVWTNMTAVDTDGRVEAEYYLKTFYTAYRWFSSNDLFDQSRSLAEIEPDLALVVGDRRVYSGEIYSQMIMGNLVHTSTVLLTRERLGQAGFFDESRRSGEDHEFHLRACRAGRVAFVDVPSILYQVGRTDQLTRPEYKVQMATKFLSVVTSALEQDRDRIKLPPHMIDEVLADAHGWLGEALFESGSQREARPHMRQSLRHKPGQLRLLRLYATAFLPPAAQQQIRYAYQEVKKRLT